MPSVGRPPFFAVCRGPLKGERTARRDERPLSLPFRSERTGSARPMGSIGRDRTPARKLPVQVGKRMACTPPSRPHLRDVRKSRHMREKGSVPGRKDVGAFWKPSPEACRWRASGRTENGRWRRFSVLSGVALPGSSGKKRFFPVPPGQDPLLRSVEAGRKKRLESRRLFGEASQDPLLNLLREATPSERIGASCKKKPPAF